MEVAEVDVPEKFRSFALMKVIGLRQGLRFPQIFELGVWLIYVLIYKYSYYLESMTIKREQVSLLPYPQLMIYALIATFYMIPFYRWIAPYFLNRNKTLQLLFFGLLYIAFASKLSNVVTNGLFLNLNGPDSLLHMFYSNQLKVSQQQATYLFAGWNLNLLITDLIAFTCISFVYFAFASEKKRFELQRENMLLQFDVLKTQLQPHYLFNTLNSIYSLSLNGSKETPHFIMLLSQMMRHILYNGSKESIPIGEEISFLEHCIEMEQKKYPLANISFTVIADQDKDLHVPPLLLLPLMENSFKHGAHRLTNEAFVKAAIKLEGRVLYFYIENSVYKHPTLQLSESGGIGLKNMRQRLQLYYPNGHVLTLTEKENIFKAELSITIP